MRLPGEPRGLAFCVLGPLRVEAPQHEVRIGGVRRRGVLLRLLASPGRSVPVDVLTESVWDGDPPHAAFSTLQSHVSAIRQAIGPDRLSFGDGGYQLRVEAGELDSLMFEQDVAVGRAAIAGGEFAAAVGALDRALSRWRGEAFADVLGSAWSVLPAGHLEEVRNTAVEEGLEARLALGCHDEVCLLAEEAVAAEPYRERRWAALMLALYRAGRQAQALDAYRRLRERLAEELGLDPSPQLSRLEHDILLQSAELDLAGTVTASVAEMSPVLPETAASRGNLPAPVASFVGRSSELAELGSLLALGRLVTIVGTGGAGKTRLAIEVAASQLSEYQDGAWFVDLAEVSDPAGVVGAVADAIGLRQTVSQQAAQMLAERAASMRALLVFDNCEHLVESVAATVERVLEVGAGLRVLATSRQPLGLPGEAVWLTPPISFPSNPLDRDPAGLASFDAVRLFIDRAGFPGVSGDMSPDDLRVIAGITARLEGLPLAIELAAARAGQLDLHQLASVLDDRLELSWLESRTAHGRHQTLAATIGWSYDLLTPALQAALKRFSVFSGGFTLEAAAAVIGAAGDVTETVVLLAERSLIMAERSASPDHKARAPIRYRMLEIIRQYCAGRVAEEDGTQGEATARDAHSRYFGGLARQASAALTGWHQGRWLTTLEADHANLVAAVNHLLARPASVDKALQMIIDLDRFWQNRGHAPECAALLRRGLEAAGQDVSTVLRCGALNLAARASAGHDLQAARSYIAESLQIARAAHDDFHIAGALSGLAHACYYTGDAEEGAAAARDAVELARALGDPVLLGECLIAFGLFAGDPAARRAIYEEALAVTRRAGDRINMAWSHSDLGMLALAEDDLKAARQHFEQEEATLREIGDPSSQPLEHLGWVFLRSGDLAAAHAAVAEALQGYELLHDRHDASYAILALACCAAAQQEWERAACLFGFADDELQACGGSWSGPERIYRQQWLAEVEHRLEGVFDRWYAAGRAGDRIDLIDFAFGQARHAVTR